MRPRSRLSARLLAVAFVAAAGLALPLAAPTHALPNCGYVVTYYSDAAKTNPVGWRYVEPEECGCGVTWVGEPGRYTSVSLLTSCLP